MKLPEDVVNFWPEPSDEVLGPDETIAELKRLRKANNSSPMQQVELTDGRTIHVELRHDRDELVITDAVVPQDPVG